MPTLTSERITRIASEVLQAAGASAENGDIRRMVELATPDLKPEEPARRRDRHCFHGLDRDRRDGREVAGTLYGGVVPER